MQTNDIFYSENLRPQQPPQKTMKSKSADMFHFAAIFREHRLRREPACFSISTFCSKAAILADANASGLEGRRRQETAKIILSWVDSYSGFSAPSFLIN